MTRKEYRAQMRELFIKNFGEDFREHRLEILRALRIGAAPKINELYQLYTYGPDSSSILERRYNIWDYHERFNRLWRWL